MQFRTILLGCLLAFSTGTALAAQNWTSIQGDNLHTGYVDVKSDPAKLHTLWNKKLEINYPSEDNRRRYRKFKHGVIVIDNTLYATIGEFFFDKKTREEIYPTSAITALDTNTGNTKWQNIIGYEDEVSRPLYDGTRVLVTGYNDNLYLKAYHSASGVLDYTNPVNGFTLDGPLAYHGNIYIQHVNYVADIGEIYSYNTTTGKLNWVQPSDSSNEHPPVLAMNDQTLIQILETGIEVRDPKTGRVSFTINLPKGIGRNQAGHHYPIFDERNNIVYHVFRDWKTDDGFWSLVAIDLNTRSIKWKKGNQSALQPTLAGNEMVTAEYYTTDMGESVALVILDAATGKEKWRWAPANEQDKIDGYYLTTATQDLIFVPCKSKTIAISRKSHEKVWEIDKSGELAIGDNKLFVVHPGEEVWDVTAIALS